jgi:hypothetical protein
MRDRRISYERASVQGSVAGCDHTIVVVRGLAVFKRQFPAGDDKTCTIVAGRNGVPYRNATALNNTDAVTDRAEMTVILETAMINDGLYQSGARREADAVRIAVADDRIIDKNLGRRRERETDAGWKTVDDSSSRRAALRRS